MRSSGSRHFGCRDTKEAALGEQSHEVPKLGTRDTWQNHAMGPKDRQVDTHHIVEEVNTILSSRVSGIRKTRSGSSASKLTKQREEKSDSGKPRRWSCAEGVDSRELYS